MCLIYLNYFVIVIVYIVLKTAAHTKIQQILAECDRHDMFN